MYIYINIVYIYIHIYIYTTIRISYLFFIAGSWSVLDGRISERSHVDPSSPHPSGPVEEEAILVESRLLQLAAQGSREEVRGPEIRHQTG